MTIIITILIMIMIGGLLLVRREFNQFRLAKALAHAEVDTDTRLNKIRQDYWSKTDHISYTLITRWADGEMENNFLERKLAGEWKFHVQNCPECQEIIKFCRIERDKKTAKEHEKELQN